MEPNQIRAAQVRLSWVFAIKPGDRIMLGQEGVHFIDTHAPATVVRVLLAITAAEKAGFNSIGSQNRLPAPIIELDVIWPEGFGKV